MLTALALCGSLKPVTQSKTASFVRQLFDAMHEIDPDISTNLVQLLGQNILPGTDRDMGAGDVWPSIATRIDAADILILATPIWWANRSSLMQRAIERMDSYTDKKGFGNLKGRVAGIIISGGEDGGQQVQGQLMEFLTYVGYTLPSFCGYYNLGQDNDATIKIQIDTLAQSLVETAKLVQPLRKG